MPESPAAYSDVKDAFALRPCGGTQAPFCAGKRTKRRPKRTLTQEVGNGQSPAAIGAGLKRTA